MFKNIKCRIPSTESKQKNNTVNKFIQTIWEEDRRVKQLRAQEIQSTAENPRNKAENETFNISVELKQHKQERFVEQKRRQQLRANSEDLRQLQIQVRAAHVSKTLVEQKAELDHIKQHQLQIKRQEDADIQKEYKKSMELARAQEQKEYHKKVRLREVLQDQMAEIQVKRMQNYQEVLKDKDDMQKVLEKVAAEQAQEFKDLINRREQAKQEMHNFLVSQELFKQHERQQNVDDNEMFLKIMRQRDAETKDHKDKKRMQLERNQACSEKIGQQLYKLESEKRRRENLLLDLLVEERKAKEDLRHRQNAEKQHRQHAHARIELERYREDTRRLKLNRQKDEEMLLKQQESLYLAEQAKIQQLSDEKQRQKVEVHRKELLEMIQDQRDQRAKASAELMHEFEILSNQQRERQEFIEKERIRILKEQPREVLRFLPAGVVRESDREILALPPLKGKC